MKRVVLIIMITLLAFETYSQGVKFNELRTTDSCDYVVLTDGIGFDTILKSEFGGGGGMDSLYNGDRTIGRVPEEGDNLGATTFREWLDWWYIEDYSHPTISMSNIGVTIVEVGTSINYTLNGSVDNPCNFTLSNGVVDGTSFTPLNYTKSVNWQPTTKTTKVWAASIQWDEIGSTCEDGSPDSGSTLTTRYSYSVHPILWGVSATSYTSGSVPYTWSKLVQSEGNKTLTLPSDTNVFIYFLIPKSWNDYNLSSILDHNGFEVLPSFTTHDVSVTSTGLVNNWTQDYKLYKLNALTSTTGSEAYQIKR